MDNATAKKIEDLEWEKYKANLRRISAEESIKRVEPEEDEFEDLCDIVHKSIEDAKAASQEIYSLRVANRVNN